MVIQEKYLHQNWKTRKSFSTTITTVDNIDIAETKLETGFTIYYIIKEETPLGRVACLEYPAFVQISSSYISPQFRRQGLGLITYRAIIQHRLMLVSDYDLSPGACALWRRLSREHGIRVERDSYQYIGRPDQIIFL